jgi:hypothetical protein
MLSGREHRKRSPRPIDFVDRGYRDEVPFRDGPICRRGRWHPQLRVKSRSPCLKASASEEATMDTRDPRPGRCRTPVSPSCLHTWGAMIGIGIWCRSALGSALLHYRSSTVDLGRAPPGCGIGRNGEGNGLVNNTSPSTSSGLCPRRRGLRFDGPFRSRKSPCRYSSQGQRSALREAWSFDSRQAMSS